MEKPFPKKITPTPIIEASIELRFESSVAREIVYPLIYTALADTYAIVKPLQILEIPHNIINMDPTLRSAPQYEFKNDSNISIFVGPEVISITYRKQDATLDYPGWTNSMRADVLRVIEKVNKTGCIKKITRLGIRYLDFFENQKILKHSEIQINSPLFGDSNKESTIRTVFRCDNVENIIMILENATIDINNTNKNGSLIDIDSYILFDENTDFNALPESFLDEVHDTNKQIFFTLLKKDFIDLTYISEY